MVKWAKHFVSLALCIVFMTVLVGCYELNEGTEEDYHKTFAESCEFVSYNRNGSIKYSNLDFSIFTNSEDDEFYVEKEGKLEFNNYRFFQVKIERKIILTQLCIYIKYDKVSSGTECQNLDTISLNFFVTSSKVNTVPHSADSSDYGGLLADTYEFDPDKADAIIEIENGSWGQGNLITFSNSFEVEEGQWFVIYFADNNDFEKVPKIDVSEDDPTFDGYVFEDIILNDKSFIVDKLMFRIEEV